MPCFMFRLCTTGGRPAPGPTSARKPVALLDDRVKKATVVPGRRARPGRRVTARSDCHAGDGALRGHHPAAALRSGRKRRRNRAPHRRLSSLPGWNARLRVFAPSTWREKPRAPHLGMVAPPWKQLRLFGLEGHGWRGPARPSSHLLPRAVAGTCHTENGPVLPTVVGERDDLVAYAPRKRDEASRLHEMSGFACPVLEVQDEARFLSPLPLSLVDHSARPRRHSRWLGHPHARSTDGRLPKSEVGRRLGQAGIDLWNAPRGRTRPADRTLRAQPPRTFAAHHGNWSTKSKPSSRLLFVLRRFVDRLALQLTQANLVAGQSSSLRTRWRDCWWTRPPNQRGFRLPEPPPALTSCSARCRLIWRRFTRVIHQRRAPGDHPTRPLVRSTGCRTGCAIRTALPETLARVEAVVGRDRVGTPGLEPTLPARHIFQEKPVDPAWWVRCYRRRSCRRSGFRSGVFVHPWSAGDHRSPRAGVRCAVASLTAKLRRRRGPWRRSGEWWKPERWAGEEWTSSWSAAACFA